MSEEEVQKITAAFLSETQENPMFAADEEASLKDNLA